MPVVCNGDDQLYSLGVVSKTLSRVNMDVPYFATIGLHVVDHGVGKGSSWT